MTEATELKNNDLNIRLINACISGNLAKVKKLILMGADIFHDNHNTLYNAYNNKKIDVVLFLYKEITKNMDTHAKNLIASSLSGLAMSDSHIEVLEYLNKTGDLVHKSSFPLYNAAKENQLKLFKYLCENGYDASDETRLINYASFHDDRLIVFEMFELGFDKQLLANSIVGRGDISSVRKMASLNYIEKPNTLLGVAAANGQVEIVKYIHQQYDCNISYALHYGYTTAAAEITAYANSLLESEILKKDIKENNTRINKKVKL